jgi:hypothetical protein
MKAYGGVEMYLYRFYHVLGKVEEASSTCCLLYFGFLPSFASEDGDVFLGYVG